MLQNSSDMTFNGSYRCNIDRIDDEITQHNLPESFSISTIITAVTTTTESKVDRVVCSADADADAGTTDISTKTGLLKRLLIGGVILTGVGALAAGCYGYYMAGRQSAGGHSENIRLPYPSEPPALTTGFLLEVDERSSTMAESDPGEVVNSTLIPETSLSPYSYYEHIYGNAVTRNNTQLLAPVILTDKLVTTTEKPVVTTTQRSTSAYMTTKPAPPPEVSEEKIKVYNHDRVRDILYRTRAENYEYPMPLGPIFHERISSFCHSKKVKDIIEKAYTGDTGLRCKLLKRIVDTISKFKLNEAGVLERNNQLETLLRYEYIEEVTIRRKLTTLLMAAEFIIDKKDFNAFYVAAMNDYKQYSVSEIAIREKNILSFSRGKNVFGKC